MNILLDTHTFIWYVEGSDELSSNAKKHIEDSDAFRVAQFRPASLDRLKHRSGVKKYRPFPVEGHPLVFVLRSVAQFFKINEAPGQSGNTSAKIKANIGKVL